MTTQVKELANTFGEVISRPLVLEQRVAVENDRGSALWEAISKDVGELRDRPIALMPEINIHGTITLTRSDYEQARQSLMSILDSDAGSWKEFEQGAFTFFPEEEIVHLRSSQFYDSTVANEDDLELRAANYTSEYVAVSKILYAMINHKIFANIEAIGDAEKILVLGTLDYLRDISLKLKYTVENASIKEEVKQEFLEFTDYLVEAAYNSYFGIVVNGSTDTDLEPITRNSSQNVVEIIANKYFKYAPKNYRELDNPVKMLALSSDIVRRNSTYDTIIEFPYGSVGLGQALNSASQALTGKKIGSGVVACYTSGYRLGESNLEETIPISHRSKLQAETKRVLLVDDNMVSGATLILAKSLLKEKLPNALIDAAAVDMYPEGLQDWSEGRYQFLIASTIQQLWVNFNIDRHDETGQRILNDLFYAPQDTLQKLGIYPIDNQGNEIREPYVLWKPMLKVEDFAFVYNANRKDLYDSLVRLYGFQDFSLIYNETLNVLDYMPVGRISVDEIPQYVKSLADNPPANLP